MIRWTPFRLIWLGGALMVLGVVLPVLMILQMLESNWLTNFVAYFASFGGLLIGMIGVVNYARTQRRTRREDEDYFDEE